MQPSKIKLLKFIANFYIGGAERQLVNLARRLDTSRFELSFACLDRSGEFLGDIEALDRPITEYKINCFYNHRALKEGLRFARDVRRERIQIVHTYNFYSNVFAIPGARLGRAPIVIASILDMGVYLTPRMKLAQKWVCRLADHIMVNAEAVRQWLIADGYQPDKITVIHNGVDLSRFTGKESGSSFRRQLGIPSHSPVVAMISRLNRLKGIDYFLAGMATVATRFPEARFLIVGDQAPEDDGYREELERDVIRLGLGERTFFTGFRLDVPELLSEVTVSVLPSLSEGFPNAVLESMAGGVPVVATRVGGNPEAIEEGVTGFLVPPREPAALARAICALLENRELALSFGRAGRKRVAEHFSLEHMTRETEGLYLELLERESRRITEPAPACIETENQ